MKVHRFFTEGNGEFSMTRLIMFLTIILVMFIVTYSLIKNLQLDLIGLSMLLGTAITGKVVQKFREHDGPRNGIDDPDEI